MKRKIGIYEILNKVNGKRYIGQSISIKDRLSNHKCQLTRVTRSKDCNRHLYNAVSKYGIRSFSFSIIEECIADKLDERELHWIKYFNTTNRDFGYNLRTDIGGRGFTHEETKQLIRENNLGEANPNYGNKWSEEKKLYMSKLKKKQYEDGLVKVNMEHIRKGIDVRNKRWEENPELKRNMAKKVSDNLRKYDIAKLDYNTLEVIEVYRGRLDLKEKNPDYYTQAILGCCSGTKNSYKGFKWKYVNRESENNFG